MPSHIQTTLAGPELDALDNALLARADVLIVALQQGPEQVMYGYAYREARRLLAATVKLRPILAPILASRIEPLLNMNGE